MIAALVHVVESLFQTYGAWGVFLASVIEEAVAPIPSALVMMGGGFGLLLGQPFSWYAVWQLLWLVAVPAAAGVALGSLVVYGLTYYFGKPFLERYGKFFGLSWLAIEQVQARFARGYADEVVLLVVRAVPALPSVAISAFCGLTRMPVKPYLLYSFLGTIVRALILSWLGWQLGKLYTIWAGVISRIESYLIVAFGTILVVYILFRIVKYYRTSSTD
jgi:membrane protein DedA with SNARE-associated domain